MAAELLKRSYQASESAPRPFVMRSTRQEVPWTPGMASKSPVLARIAEGAKGLPDSLQANMDEHGRIVLDDLQFGPEALATLLAFCAGEELDLRALTAAQRVEACRCADFYDMCASYRSRVGAALLTTLDGESADATEIDFTMVPLTLGPLVQSVSISNVTIRNLTLARCHIGAASFRDCNIHRELHLRGLGQHHDARGGGLQPAAVPLLLALRAGGDLLRLARAGLPAPRREGGQIRGLHAHRRPARPGRERLQGLDLRDVEVQGHQLHGGAREQCGPLRRLLWHGLPPDWWPGR
ncbi:unnamed protein product [Prorocentrum cordatum]|uniref:Pentapeptide repeat-containing protein n=1 Tax=Prorocentrum cordatum TaxID=2364126 RepID=A0ABN9SMG8_9DINO|nr:unnamed protein product [Polarella glacialis]